MSLALLQKVLLFVFKNHQIYIQFHYLLHKPIQIIKNPKKKQLNFSLYKKQEMRQGAEYNRKASLPLYRIMKFYLATHAKNQHLVYSTCVCLSV
jgi:hypothetical protein